jgi:hypothetical protein
MHTHLIITHTYQNLPDQADQYRYSPTMPSSIIKNQSVYVLVDQTVLADSGRPARPHAAECKVELTLLTGDDLQKRQVGHGW